MMLHKILDVLPWVVVFSVIAVILQCSHKDRTAVTVHARGTCSSIQVLGTKVLHRYDCKEGHRCDVLFPNGETAMVPSVSLSECL